MVVSSYLAVHCGCSLLCTVALLAHAVVHSDRRSAWRSSWSSLTSLSAVITSCFTSVTGIMMTDTPDALKVRRTSRLDTGGGGVLLDAVTG